MIRTSSHILKFATNFKKQKLEDLFVEHKNVMNQFIDMFWDMEKLPYMANKEHYDQIDSWLLTGAKQCIGKQVLGIMRSVHKKDKELIYKAYRKAFAKAKKKNKNWDIVNQRWSEWSKNKKFRHRVNKPVYMGDSIELTSTVSKIQEPKLSVEFDLWICLSSIFGNRFSLILPTKKHAQYNNLIDAGFKTRKSIRLRKYNKNFYVDLFHEKKTSEARSGNNVIGIDIGINKLMTTSDGIVLGIDIKSKINKLNKRQQGSKNYNQTIQEIKHYIGESVNNINWGNIDVLVLEDLKNITKSTKGKLNKTTQKLLGHWNLNHLVSRIKDRSEENRIHLQFIPPAYTSQKCSNCGSIHKESRNGELYTCVKCGFELDSDLNASINIRNQFLNEEFTVPHEQKHN